MIKCKYCELKVGELFSLKCPYVEKLTSVGTHRVKDDKRVFRKEIEGASQVVDMYGNKCEASDWRMYPYKDMTVYKIEVEGRGN